MDNYFDQAYMQGQQRMQSQPRIQGQPPQEMGGIPRGQAQQRGVLEQYARGKMMGAVDKQINNAINKYADGRVAPMSIPPIGDTSNTAQEAFRASELGAQVAADASGSVIPYTGIAMKVLQGQDPTKAIISTGAGMAANAVLPGSGMVVAPLTGALLGAGSQPQPQPAKFEDDEDEKLLGAPLSNYYGGYNDGSFIG